MSSNFGTPLPSASPLPVLVPVTGTASLSGESYGKVYYASGSGGFSISLPSLAAAFSGYTAIVTIINDCSSAINVSAVGSDVIHIAGSSGATLTLGVGERVAFYNKASFWVADTISTKVNRAGDTLQGPLYLPSMDVSDNSLRACHTKFVNDLLAARAYAPLLSPTFTGVVKAPTASSLVRNGTVVNDYALMYAAPPGTICYFATKTPPTGWLKANGAAITVATYGDLASAIYTGDATNSSATWGYRFSYSGFTLVRSTTGLYMALPDLRGEFIRGWDDSRGVDINRQFGTAQTWQFTRHTHSASGGSRYGMDGTNTGTGFYGSSGDSGAGGTGETTAAGGTENGSETRPRNIALLACIKY